MQSIIALHYAEPAKYFVRSSSRIIGPVMFETALRYGVVLSMLAIISCASSSAEARPRDITVTIINTSTRM